MFVGICRIELFLHSNDSLKGKRRILKSIKERIRNNFNVSISEVGSNDKWQTAEIGVAAISNEKRHLNSILNKVVDFIDAMHTAEMVGYNIEIY
ncbi:MAG: DUF503 domain-containing protein [Nitrospinota bacterium]|jgi:uncharacterized protein YlxP (DUF503 family)